MSPASDTAAAFHAPRILAMLVGITLLAWAMLRVLLPQLFGPSAVRAVDVAAAAAGSGAVAGLLPVATLAARGVMATVWGYFMGAAGRALIALAALLVASRYDIAAEPMALALMAIYLPLLAVEAGFVGRYLWQLDGASGVSTLSAVKGNA